ncbi:MAG: LysR family transcriptional regulator [Betaproteobacteria bacterium]|nr:LysR family transcriptional regulator [Betaproteobacteria bacterium]
MSATKRPLINAHRVDLTSLRILLAVAQTGSITQAAEQCHLALGAASTRMKELEQRLGVELLERHARGVRLTEAGQLVLDRARAIERELGRLQVELEDHQQGVTGHIRVIANVSSIATVLPNDLTAFLQSHQGIRIDLSEYTSREIQRMLADGQADIGVLAGPVTREDLESAPYYKDRLVIMLPRDAVPAHQKKMTIDQLLTQDLILSQEGGSISEWLADLARLKGQLLHVRVRAKGFDALSQLVAAGLGVTVLPEIVAKRFAKLLDLRILGLEGIQDQRLIAVSRRLGGSAQPAAQDLFAHLAGRLQG